MTNTLRTSTGAWRLLATGVFALLLAGCASTGAPGQPAPVAEGVEQRSTQRWDHLLAKQYVEAYGFLTPGHRAKLTPERYAAQVSVLPVKWTSAEVLGSECVEDRCDVRVDLGYRVRSHLPGVGWIESRRVVVEKWLRLDGSWYYLPEGAS